MSDSLLSIEDLVVEFATDEGLVRAVDGVSFDIKRGETVGVVGESGCGKTVTALSVVRLLASPPGRYASGKIVYEGRDLLSLKDSDMRRLRGNRISMIFQEPMTSLNPVFTVGEQIAETMRLHQGLSKKQAHAKAIEMLDLVGIPAAGERVGAYPHQLSGGMRQRVMIAIALSCKPDLLIADEPTTALDVTIQAQIMDLLKNLQKEMGMSIMLITHDLGVVAETCDRVVVMYAGKVAEQGGVHEIFGHPQHPYTYGLLGSIPSFDNAAPSTHVAAKGRLRTIPGTVPNLLMLKPGCRFYDRCFQANDNCRPVEPQLSQTSATHQVRCLYPLSKTEQPSFTSSPGVQG
jgi:oligopeptide/dipeptide ABC transporter ATP-binding protein